MLKQQYSFRVTAFFVQLVAKTFGCIVQEFDLGCCWKIIATSLFSLLFVFLFSHALLFERVTGVSSYFWRGKQVYFSQCNQRSIAQANYGLGL